VAYSGLVRGAGILAGGPYYCAEGKLGRAVTNCMAPTQTDSPPPATDTLKRIAHLADTRQIDPVNQLKDDRVWLLSGGQDKTVAPAVMDQLAEFYRGILPAEALRYVKVADAGHAMLSVADPKANACNTSSPPFINRCQDIDAPGQLLNHLLGPLKAPAASPDGDIIAFDQRPYLKGAPVDASLADEGYAFIPAACRSGGCRIHVAFHGCRQNHSEIGTRFIESAGYNRWAASNRLIVLYPQTVARSGLAFGSFKVIVNPKACWDWWGYSGDNYHTRDGVQMKAVRAMIDGLVASRP
jgi:poly(3-hydroxybutyrate) depolymerase